MTAPDRTTWTVAPDHEGDETLWFGDIAVLRECDLATGGGGSAAIARAYRRELFNLLTRVLAPDEATVERLAEAVSPALFASKRPGEKVGPATLYERGIVRTSVQNVLAALADTLAQARHTGGDAKDDCPSYSEMTGGGEHG